MQPSFNIRFTFPGGEETHEIPPQKSNTSAVMWSAAPLLYTICKTTLKLAFRNWKVKMWTIQNYCAISTLPNLFTSVIG